MDATRANEACLRAFGEEVVVAGRAVRAIVSAPVEAHELDRSGRVQASLRLDLERPALRLLDADAAGLAQGDPATLRGRDYAIARLRPDGAGMTEATLMPVPGRDAAGAWR